jgi:hypothetical protein
LTTRKQWQYTIVFFNGFVVEKKKVMTIVAVAFFYGGVVEKKKAMVIDDCHRFIFYV